MEKVNSALMRSMGFSLERSGKASWRRCEAGQDSAVQILTLIK